MCFQPFKTPGLDEIFPALLQAGRGIIGPLLCRIFRACLVFGHIPLSWRSTKVVFIPKPGKDCYAEAKAFRPICLSSFLLKTLEKLIDHYIREEMLGNIPLSSFQFAYQPGKSTETALYTLSYILEQNFKYNETALAVFLDIEGAFDKVPKSSIMNSLSRRGANDVLTGWISSYLSNRIISATLFSDTVQCKAQRGCLQGGVLSPLLWSLVVDDLLVKINNTGITCIGYADDLVIISRGKFPNTVGEIMRNALRMVETWCNREGLTVNPAKTTMVAFTRKRSPNFGDIFFYGKSLAFASDVKYLGIFLDEKLTWKRHLDYSINKAKKVFWACRRPVGKNWGINPKVLRWIYCIIIRPIISYGAIVWWSRTCLDSVKRELGSLQRMACIALTGALRTTPTASMELLLDLLPLHLHIEAEALACMHRLACLGFWKGNSDSLLWGQLNTVIRNSSIFNMPSDCMLGRHAFEKPFKIDFPTREDWMNYQFNSGGNNVNWFTDGSYMNGMAGAGIFCASNNLKFTFSLGCFSTVFQAEVFAISMCASICLEKHAKNRSIYIFSDSQAALKALGSFRITSKLVWDCYQTLCRLTSHNKVALIWVPGHTGIQVNKEADELARQGSSCPINGPEPAFGISRAFVKSVILGEIRTQQVRNWLDIEGQRQAKEICGLCPRKRAKELLYPDRNNLRKAIGLLSGHCLNRHLHLIGVCDDPICRICRKELETVKHVLCECEALSGVRFKYLDAHFIQASDISGIPIKVLLKFISATGLL